MTRLNARDARARANRLASSGLNPGDFSEALARGLQIMKAFDHEHRRMTLAEAASVVSLPRATVRRTLMTLVHLGYLVQDDKAYELAPRVLELASAYLMANPLSAILQPTCETLCAKARESCTVAVLDGEEAVMIARAVPNNFIYLGTGIGYRVPALHSALGRVLLAALDEKELEQFLQSAQPQKVTPLTVTGKTELLEIIKTVRADGYAYADREAESGFHSIAVPLHRWDGRPVAAINIGAHTDRVDQATMLGPMLDLLRKTSATLRHQLI